MENYTIAETYTLPSKGLIYTQQVSPQVTLRSMTTEEEMKRLSHTETPYKTLCTIIDDCMVEPIGISSYDMHLGDYQFLLHKLRVVTYGSTYSSSSVCPVCGRTNKVTVDLDKLAVFSCDSPFADDDINIVLPKTGKKIALKFQTPRDLDEIAREEKEYLEKNPEEEENINYLLSLRHVIDKVDDKKQNHIWLDQFLRKLPLADSNYLLQKAAKLNDKVGVDTVLFNECSNSRCGAKYRTSFRITAEFFGPTVD